MTTTEMDAALPQAFASLKALAAPLCRARAHDPAIDGMEIALKGGQLGNIDFFGCLRRGGD